VKHVFNVSTILLKTAHVVPSFKLDDKMIINSYRPVSVLSVFSKIYEEAMYKRLKLNNYSVKNNFLTDNQFVQHSTSI